MEKKIAEKFEKIVKSFKKRPAIKNEKNFATVAPKHKQFLFMSKAVLFSSWFLLLFCRRLSANKRFSSTFFFLAWNPKKQKKAKKKISARKFFHALLKIEQLWRKTRSADFQTSGRRRKSVLTIIIMIITSRGARR